MSAIVVRAQISDRDERMVQVGQPMLIWVEGQRKRWHSCVTGFAVVMGRRTARSLGPSDRFDSDSREAIVAVNDADVPPVVGLRVMVGAPR